MIAKICAWAGSIGCGLSFIDIHWVAPTRIGSTPIARNAGGLKWSRPNRLTGVSGSGADRSLIHRTNGWWRISTLTISTL